ncbi:MAG: HAD family hydrolase [Chloroflexota bacterium]|nr:HAD family hydrolase [Chloroflexota bacterium]
MRADDPSLAKHAAHVYLEQRVKALRLYPDVRRALASLRAVATLVLVTNGASDTQRTAIEATGLSRYFAAIVVSGEVGIAKPDPAIFVHAAAAAGAPLAGGWHVGDGISDLRGSRDAGMAAIWMNRHGSPLPSGAPDPDAEVTTLTDVRRLAAQSL